MTEILSSTVGQVGDKRRLAALALSEDPHSPEAARSNSPSALLHSQGTGGTPARISDSQDDSDDEIQASPAKRPALAAVEESEPADGGWILPDWSSDEDEAATAASVGGPPPSLEGDVERKPIPPRKSPAEVGRLSLPELRTYLEEQFVARGLPPLPPGLLEFAVWLNTSSGTAGEPGEIFSDGVEDCSSGRELLWRALGLRECGLLQLATQLISSTADGSDYDMDEDLEQEGNDVGWMGIRFCVLRSGVAEAAVVVIAVVVIFTNQSWFSSRVHPIALRVPGLSPHCFFLSLFVFFLAPSPISTSRPPGCLRTPPSSSACCGDPANPSLRPSKRHHPRHPRHHHHRHSDPPTTASQSASASISIVLPVPTQRS